MPAFRRVSGPLPRMRRRARKRNAFGRFAQILSEFGVAPSANGYFNPRWRRLRRMRPIRRSRRSHNSDRPRRRETRFEKSPKFMSNLSQSKDIGRSLEMKIETRDSAITPPLAAAVKLSKSDLCPLVCAARGVTFDFTPDGSEA